MAASPSPEQTSTPTGPTAPERTPETQQPVAQQSSAMQPPTPQQPSEAQQDARCAPSQDLAVALATYVAAFFDELARWGVQDVVVSPGSRSTPLALAADASPLNLYVDVDERGAAFFALGLAKAKQRPVVVVCTSGTALGNHYPAVLEAESSRVPLLVLSGDRPARLQQVGAPQTFDQIKAFSDHVEGFWNMPAPSDGPSTVAYARQIAREACIAMGACGVSRGPAHVNFPFDEPLLPDLDVLAAAFARQDAAASVAWPGNVDSLGQDDMAATLDDMAATLELGSTLPPFVRAEAQLGEDGAQSLAAWLATRRPLVLCGEGTLSQRATGEEHAIEAACLFAFAECFDAPLIADPLSNLRSFSNRAIVDCADALFARGEVPAFDAVVRFGRYPVSKSVTTWLERHLCPHVVVDPYATRDMNAATTMFVPCTPDRFVEALLDAASLPEFVRPSQLEALDEWRVANHACAKRAGLVAQEGADGFEGTYVDALVRCLPEDALLFVGNSMSVRAVDTFYRAVGKSLTLLGNRGLNGIDGTLSSAIGAAHAFEHAALLVGDLAFLHDVNALALQHELLLRGRQGNPVPQLTVVVLDNNGGAIFDMLPQRSERAYFERLFLTPQDCDVSQAASAFGVPCDTATTCAEFEAALAESLRRPGLSVVRVPLPLRGVRERYAPYK